MNAFWFFVADFLPKKIIYCAVVRAACEAAGNDKCPADITASEMLERAKA